MIEHRLHAIANELLTKTGNPETQIQKFGSFTSFREIGMGVNQMGLSQTDGKMEGWLCIIRSNRFGLQNSRMRYFVLEDHHLKIYKSIANSKDEVISAVCSPASLPPTQISLSSNLVLSIISPFLYFIIFQSCFKLEMKFQCFLNLFSCLF